MKHRSYFIVGALTPAFALAPTPAKSEPQNWMPAILSSGEFLPDYSYAGYYWGEKRLPDLEPTLEVTEFGAIPDDGKDDTAAIQAAVEAAKQQPGMVVLHFPAGKFILSDVVYIERSDFVIQGEGSVPEATVISVPGPLKDMNVPWSTKLLKELYGDGNLSMGRRLYGWPWNPILTQAVTIGRVQGQYVFLKEPLLHDLRPQWTPKFVGANYLQNIGIENLRIEFPSSQYAGHHLEAGYNGIYLTDVMHSWIHNVSVNNSDSAILTNGCKNITLDGITVTGRPGHYTVMTAHCYGVLSTRFQLLADSVHNPSFNTKAELCVYSGGTIGQARLDQHRGINHQNLFDNIEIDTANNIFAHGGAHYWGPTAGRYNTLWNIRIRNTPDNGFIGQCRGPRKPA